MGLIDEEAIAIFAYNLYRKDIKCQDLVWTLASVCKTLQLNFEITPYDE
jgi:hypothetical protein